jgi:hypothetical protein
MATRKECQAGAPRRRGSLAKPFAAARRAVAKWSDGEVYARFRGAAEFDEESLIRPRWSQLA